MKTGKKQIVLATLAIVATGLFAGCRSNEMNEPAGADNRQSSGTQQSWQSDQQMRKGNRGSAGGSSTSGSSSDTRGGSTSQP